MERLFICLLSLLLFVSETEGQTCDSPDTDVMAKCSCQSSYMECHDLQKIPPLPLTLEITQVKIIDSYLGTLDKTMLNTDYDQVETLMLQNCEVTFIENNTFNFVNRLKHLSFINNRIKVIHKDTFKGLPDLEVLNLSKNVLETLPVELLETLSRLKVLDLSYNVGLHFQESMFAGSTLEELYLHHTGFHSIPTQMLSSSKNLKRVGLNGNFISVIPAHAFIDLPDLELISLVNNNISMIDDSAFEGLPKLLTLNLQKNKLTELNPLVMAPIGDTLEDVYLDYNLLTTLEADVIRHDIIRHVRLGHNPWNCDCNIKWMKDLDLRHRDPGNVTCDMPEKLRGHAMSNVTEEMLCAWCDGCNKSTLALAIFIPILIICSCLIGYYVYRIMQNRKQRAQLRKAYKYSNVYRDTVEPVHSNVPPSQRA